MFTKDVNVDGRNQVTAYARLQKRFKECLFELSYNYFYTQQETLTDVDVIKSGFGIYQVSTGGGVSTASTATIDQRYSTLDATPVTTVTADLDLNSAAAKHWVSNTIAARLQHVGEKTTYGIGGSADVAASLQAISTWSVWLNLEVLLPN